MASISKNTDGTVTLYEGGRKVARGTVAEIVARLTGESAPAARVKMERPKSRSARWAEACSAAESALEDLESIRQEYEEWRENLPENLHQSALGEKLETVVDLDIQSALGLVIEASEADLPLGFGRD